MSKANTVGSLFEENYLVKNRPVLDTDAIVLVSPPLDDIDGISFQVVTAGFSSSFTIEAGDSVAEAAGTATWTFANGFFTADMVGATITISGAGEAGNNGDFVITVVTSETVIETTTTTEVDETFTGVETILVESEEEPLQVTFTVEISDNYSRGGISGLNQVPNAGDWGAVTTKFANTGSPFFPAIAGITALGAPYYQMTPLVGRFVRWTLTPSAGIGNLSFLFSAKGNR
jgi:hypothetical protein